MHNHQIEVLVNRQEKRYRYKENVEIIPTYRKKYVSTENFTGKYETLDDFAFVFKMDMHWPKWEISRIRLQWPKITAERDMMIHRFKRIKDEFDKEVEPFILSRID